MKWDAVIVGSGFGGAMVAHGLVEAGARVLMIERGDWVPRGEAAWKPEASLELTPKLREGHPVSLRCGGHGTVIGGYACVGGPSVYYGCVAFRFREQDFVGDPDVVADSGAAWPFRYDEIEPYYAEAERLLGIAGDDTGDPTAPRRSRRSRSRRRRSRRSRSASSRRRSASGCRRSTCRSRSTTPRRRSATRASRAGPATRTRARSRRRTTSRR